jgi:DNA-binding transcriptional MerR regulator
MIESLCMSRGRLTIDELARRAGTTTRNVRAYQSRGLLPPPRLQGRTGHYDEDHLARLKVISRLQESGFSLAGIGQLLRAWEGGRGLHEILGFERALTAPWSEEKEDRITRKGLEKVFPGVTDEDDLLERAVQIGLLAPDGDGFRVPSPRFLRVGAELVAAGIPLEEALDEFVALRAETDRIARRFVDLFMRHVWQPFAEEGLPPEGLPEVTEVLRRLRAIAGEAVLAALAQSMERRVAEATAAEFAQGGRAEKPAAS